MLSDAIVIVTADHGERLGEDGRYMHGGDADERVLSIPLLVYDRRPTAYPVRPIAGQVDIAPTLLAAVGAPIPPAMDGIPLQAMTSRGAVPFGTSETTGAIVRIGNGVYQYGCARATGIDSLRRLGTAQVDGQLITGNVASASLYERARAAFRGLRRAGPVKLHPC